jgi:hypothetical protein
VRAGLLGSEPFGFFQASQGLADLPLHRMGLGEVDVVPCLPFRRQPSGVDVAGEVESLPGIAQLDGDPDGVQRHVGRAELGPEVVPVLADAVSDLPCLVQVLVRLRPVVVPCRRGSCATPQPRGSSRTACP